MVGGAVMGAAGLSMAYWESKQYALEVAVLGVLPAGSLPPGRKELRILHISDLHITHGEDKKHQFVRALAATNPDLVVNTGDNIGETTAVPAAVQALTPLLSKPGIFCFGGADYWSVQNLTPVSRLLRGRGELYLHENPWRGLRAAFVEHGWYDCTNRRHEFTIGNVKLAVAGVDDPFHDLDDYASIAGAPHARADLSIGLSHSPTPEVLNNFSNDGYQLLLTGRTRGGKLLRPSTRKIVTSTGIDKAYTTGVSYWNDSVLHVSPGIGISRHERLNPVRRPRATLLRVVEENPNPEILELLNKQLEKDIEHRSQPESAWSSASS